MTTEVATVPTTSRAACEALDQHDPLGHFRERFALREGLVYLDGNSLGPAPRAAAERARAVLEQEWAVDLIGSWNKHHWFELPSRLGAKVARLVGGEQGGCVVTDTTSVNLFKVLSAALRIQAERAPERHMIVAERTSFPTDLYVASGLVEVLDRRYELHLVEGPDDLGPVLEAHGADVALVLLTHVNYRTGAMWDLAATTQAAHDAGALMVWDLCHSVGAVPLDLDAVGADFAVGCTYKYLNGGPGSPAFAWIGRRHLGAARPALTGWWGHAAPFAMAEQYAPADGARRFLTGTQPILSLATAEVGIDLALEADPEELRRKSVALTSLFIDLVDRRLSHHPLTLVTPRDPSLRGSHVSWRHPHGYAVVRALIAEGIVGDYREPEVMRFGVTPLYLRHVDVWDAVEALRRVLDEQRWRAPEHQERDPVT